MSINIPESGRVVVIDDKPKEALPLLKVLSKNGVPVTYFTGELEELPEESLESVRIVFLDLRLVPSIDEKSVISTLIGTLLKILNANNEPYFIILWSKHEVDYKNAFEKRLNNDEQLKNIRPLAIISLEKSIYLEYNGDNSTFKKDAMRNIEGKLKEKLNELGIFHLFIIWENLVHKASGKIVDDFSEFHDFDVNWNKNMGGVFLKLAEGFAGKQLDKSNNEQIVKNALFSFNSAFLDELESEIRNYEVVTAGLSFEGVSGAVDKEIIGDINSKLLLAMESSESILPGNVYDDSIDIEGVDIKELFNGNLGKSDKKDELLSQLVYIYLETSPLCDYAQDKWKVSRLLPGVLWPGEFESNKIKKAVFIYSSPLIKFGNKLYYMVFDLRFFTSIEFSKLKDKSPLFRLKHDYLVDIQSKLAPHINRPGVMFVDER